MHLADLKSYSETQERLGRLYADSQGWANKTILNVAGSGKFSSDRTIAEYAGHLESDTMSCLLGSPSNGVGTTWLREIHGDGADLYALLWRSLAQAAAWPYVSILTKDIHTGPEKLGAAFKRALS